MFGSVLFDVLVKYSVDVLDLFEIVVDAIPVYDKHLPELSGQESDLGKRGWIWYAAFFKISFPRLDLHERTREPNIRLYGNNQLAF